MRGNRGSIGWVPQQHGAWAMVAVPISCGLALAAHQGQLAWWHLPLALTWLAGYFAFNASAGALKAPSARRHRWYPATLTYLGLALAAGVVTLLGAGPAVSWWLAVLGPVIAIALILAKRRNERALLGGMLTVGAGCLMLLVARFPDPFQVVGAPDAALAFSLAALLFGYFAGSVLYVKTLLRERGSRSWLTASLLWHLCWLAISAATRPLAGSGWTAFFAAALVRAWYLPRRLRTAPVRIGSVGRAELVYSVAALVLGLIAVFSG